MSELAIAAKPCGACGGSLAWDSPYGVRCYRCLAGESVPTDELERRARQAFVGAHAPRAHKYGAQPTDGYPSKAQARRASTLKLMEQAGMICDLREEVPFPTDVNGVVVCTYRADFVYEQGGRQVVEDVKGIRTPVYRLKKRLMMACHGIEIKETR